MEEPTAERWRSVTWRGQSWPFEVSDFGRVVRVPSREPLPQYLNPHGYFIVMLSAKGVRRTVRIHRLVAEAFLGCSALTVDHVNGIKTDNRLQNLEYVTFQENRRRATEMGLLPRGSCHWKAKLTEEDVLAMRWLRGHGLTWTAIGDHFGVSRVSARNAVAAKTWHHLRMPEGYEPPHSIREMVGAEVSS